ncbi:GIY-YIG nuclease family protein [Zhongshania sp.]|uniref:GIY-YIG nuclease family protein n=1 Tax=Zhongshania sp. TaxID=1971902 RepID=UPI0035628C9D
MGIVYKITFPNGKSYIGITEEGLSRRIKRHINYARSDKPYALSAAIRKYGEDSFGLEIIGSASTREELCRMEVEAIKKHKTMCPSGYNMTGGGDGSRGVSPNSETRRRISISLTGRTLSPSHRRAVGESQKGKTIPPETRAKMSKAHQNRPPMSAEQRAIRSAAAKRQNAERRNKQRAANV